MSQSPISLGMHGSQSPLAQAQKVKVFKLQRRIYRASLSGDVRQVHRLQRLLMKSWFAKCLAVRRVTQDNQGKKNSGVDGVKLSNAPTTRIKLIVQSMELKSAATSEKSLDSQTWTSDENVPWVSQPWTTEPYRHLLKMALEPEWEAKFEPNSYGF